MVLSFRSRCLAPVLVFTVLLTPMCGVAQQSKVDPDLLEMQHYTLTMDVMNRLADSFQDIGQLAKTDPQLSSKMETEADKKEDLDGMAHRMGSSPAVVTILKSHGFTPREFALAEMVLFQAAFASGAKQAGADPAKLASDAHVNLANIAFVEQHKAEFEALQKKMAPAEKSDTPETSDTPKSNDN